MGSCAEVNPFGPAFVGGEFDDALGELPRRVGHHHGPEPAVSGASRCPIAGVGRPPGGQARRLRRWWTAVALSMPPGSTSSSVRPV